MGWLERYVGKECSEQYVQRQQAQPPARSTSTAEQSMTPGLGGDFDWELREKAGMHTPPTPPEYMELEGEYDPNGLVKRVALAFDRDASLKHLENIEIAQDGSRVILKGIVPDAATLRHMTELAAMVDGAKSVDASQVLDCNV
jgi:hypothetical protein